MRHWYALNIYLNKERGGRGRFPPCCKWHGSLVPLNFWAVIHIFMSLKLSPTPING